MKITDAIVSPYSLPLHARWQSHTDDFTTRRGALLRLEDDSGQVGYGDCAPLPDHAAAQTTLESVLPQLCGVPIVDCMDMLSVVELHPAARCALETALLDLMARHRGMPLHLYLNPGSQPETKVNAAIGALDDDISQRASAAIEKGYSVLKLKVGISDIGRELEMLSRICAELPKSVQLRLDANRAWDFATAKGFLNGIRDLPIESLEEPLAHPDLKELARLQDGTDIVLALDETLSDLADLPKLQPLRRIILKPMALGGLLPALQLGQRAQELGIEVVATATVDSAAGVWAATHLAAALDTEGQLCHGLGTGEWLQQDLGQGPDIRNGTITIPPVPGLGFTPYS